MCLFQTGLWLSNFCDVVSLSFLSIKMQVRDPDILSLSVGGLKDFELAKYEHVALIPQVRHFDIGIHVRGYFVTGLESLNIQIQCPPLMFQDRLVLCGDIETNPGPAHSSSAIHNSSSATRKKPVWKYLVRSAPHPVRANQKGILCDGCCKWFHLKCIDMDLKTYVDLGSSDEQWLCDKNCGRPFNFTDSFFESSVASESGLNMSSSTEGPAESAPCSSNFLKCLLLNTRSLRNKINDLIA